MDTIIILFLTVILLGIIHKINKNNGRIERLEKRLCTPETEKATKGDSDETI